MGSATSFMAAWAIHTLNFRQLLQPDVGRTVQAKAQFRYQMKLVLEYKEKDWFVDWLVSQMGR